MPNTAESENESAPRPVLCAPDDLVRELLVRIADKWTLAVIDELAAAGPLRFTRLRERVGHVSQKMLTKTLRELERDGLVTRKVHPVVPPHVEYTLTAEGAKFGESICGLWHWAQANVQHIESSRRAYDAAGAQSSVPDDE